MVIYADVFLAINFLLNSIVLVLTAWAAGIGYKVWRVFAAATLGSIYALGTLVADHAVFYSPFVKLIASITIVLAAYRMVSLRSLLIAIACFYLVSLLLGGAVVGWLFFFQPADYWRTGQTAWLSLSWTHLATGAVLTFVLALAAFRVLHANMARRRMLLPVVISYNGRQVTVMSLLDTGNALYGMTGRTPVVVVTQQSLVQVLSEPVQNYLRQNEPDVWLANLAECQDQEWLSRIHPIPYRAVGTHSMLLGFRPDSLTVLTETGRIKTDRVIVGIYCGDLVSDGHYHALLHPAVMQFANCKEGVEICA